MYTFPGKEGDAVKLIEKKIDHRLWKNCRILKKHQIFRFHGKYILNRSVLFPGYIFISTDTPDLLVKELQKAKSFPKFLGETSNGIAAVEARDLVFLRNICGEQLDKDMELSTVEVDEDGKVIDTSGVLKPYLEKVIRQRLRQRYVIARVPLFQREEEILFGIKMPEDRIMEEKAEAV